MSETRSAVVYVYSVTAEPNTYPRLKKTSQASTFVSSLLLPLISALALLGCDLSSETDERAATTQARNASRAPQRHITAPHHAQRPLIIATRSASPLTRGMMHQLRGGEAWSFKLIQHVDDAARAVHEGVALGAFFVHPAGEDPLKGGPLRRVEVHTGNASLKPLVQRVATSTLWWARGDGAEVNTETWRALLSGETERWPDGSLFQLCVRPHPDPLEEIWVAQYPALGTLIRSGRRQGRWSIFHDEEKLIQHLVTHPGAVGLFSAGNLRLRGAPLSQVKLTELRDVRVVLSLILNRVVTRDPLDQLHIHLERLLQALDGHERVNLIQEWGWSP